MAEESEPKDPRGQRLTARFLKGYFLGSMGLSLLLILAFSWIERRLVIEEFRKRGMAISDLFTRALPSALYQLDVEQLEEQLLRLRALPDIQDVVLFNDQGRVITDGTPSNERLGQQVPGSDQVLASRPPAMKEVASSEKLVFFSPVTLQEKVLGGVQVSLSLEGMTQEVQRTCLKLFLITTLFILIGSLPVWIVTRFLIKPFFVGGR